MAWETSVLVVATITAESDELLAAMRARAERGPTRFTLLAPATEPGSAGREAAEGKLNAALERMREAGLKVDGRVGDSDPIIAVHETWDPREYDEIIVSTLPTHESKWLLIDLPHRVARITGVPVTHVVGFLPKEPVHGEPPPKHDRLGVLAPLSVLAWGGAGSQTEDLRRAAQRSRDEARRT